MAKKILPIKSLVLTIKDHAWTFNLYTDSSYEKKHGDDSEAITVPNLKSIDFKRSKFNLGIVRHEIGHLLVDACNVTSSNLDAIQVEELCCSIIQYDIHLILSTSEIIFNKLLE